MTGSAALRRGAAAVWLVAVGALVVYHAAQLDWAEVARSLRSYSASALAIALAIALPGYLACASYDLVGRHCTGHDLPLGRSVAISFVGYCFSLNLGALIGGLAFRYRLYAPSALRPWTIGQVIALSVITNWSGYVLMAGALLAYDPPSLPSGWNASEPLLRAIGAVLLAVSAGYLWLCVRHGGERLEWRGRELVVPSLAVAGVQLALSLVSWGAIGGVITWLLGGEVSWFEVMPVLMLSAIAGVLSHVPGGLGVIEFVFASLLGHEIGQTRLVGALLAFRATYYLVPFLVSLAVYAALELTSERSDAQASRAAS